MNRKVLTLCAGLLLGGSLVNAQEAHWVKVEDPTLMLFNKAYLISNLAGDSILSQKASNYQQAYLIEKNAEDAAATDAFYVKGSATNFSIIAGQDSKGTNGLYGNAIAGPYYFNVAKSTSVLKIDKDGNINITSTTNGNNSSKVTGNLFLFRKDAAEKGDLAGVTEANDYTKYAFWMQTTSPETANDAFEVTQTLYLMSDGKYVVVNEDGNVESTETAPATDDLNAVWVVKGEGLYNVGAKKYLTWASNKFNLSETEVSFALNGPVAVINGKAAAEASLTQTNTPLPIDYGFTPIEKASDKKVILYTNDGTVITVDGSLETYTPGDAVETVWTAVAVKTGASTYEVRLQNSEAETDGYLAIADTNGEVQYVTIEGIAVDDKGNFSLPTAGGVVLKAGNDYLALQGGKLVTTSVKGQATEFGLGDIEEAFVDVATLLQRNAKSFTIDITYDKDKDGEYETDLTSIFKGELTPIQFNNTGYDSGNTWYTLANGGETNFMLMNEDNMILALNTDPDKIWSSGSNIHAYPLELITAKQYREDVLKGNNYYKTMFSFQYTPGTDASKVTSIDAIWVEGTKLGCYTDTKKVAYLAGEGTTGLAPVKISLAGTTLVDYKSWLNTPSYYKVEVANNNKEAQFYGKVLGQDEDGWIDFVAPTKTDITKPEGQFTIRYFEGTETTPAYFEFKNRENERTYHLEASKLYEVDMAKHLFAYRDNRYDLMDTLKITPINDYDPSDGFKRYTADDLNANTYNVSMKLVDESYLYIVENHDDKHRIGLDREEATDWRIEMPTVRLEDITGDLLRYVPDTVTVDVPIHYWVSINGTMKEVSTDMKEEYKGKYYNPKATLKIPTYILKNTATDEYISGDSDAEETANSYYYCPFETSATRMALKIVGDSTLNLIPVYNSYSHYNWSTPTTLNAVSEAAYEYYAAGLYLSDQKIIGGTTANTGVLKDVTRFEATSNDLFLIEETEAPTYKTLAQDDKIIISREKNNDEVIYEDGAFADIDNILAYDINPTLYVDTAYVNRPGNYRYEYLLSVRPLRTDSIDDCNNPNHEHPRTAFTEGDFLVVMRDSMDVEDDKNVHNNKYAYEGQPRLAFVSGIHQNDTLYYTNAAGEIIAKSEVGNADYNFAKFAFKMINEENNEFVVETAYGYDAVKWVNDEPVEYEVAKGYLRWIMAT